MDFEDLRALHDHMDELLQLEPLARQATLAQMEQTHPALAAELRRWLADLAAADRDGFMVTNSTPEQDDTGVLANADTVLDGSSSLASPPLVSPLNPSHIGPFHLIKLLGRGGMGTVYLAEQDHPIKRLVALKVVHRSSQSEHLWRRFDIEKQLLAFLDHRHITRLYEFGTSTSGDPYFAMEYVDGPPISNFCDFHQLALEARLRLFIDICEAVQHAHQKGIIHRDLKPGNVLVKLEEGVAVPKIIDFGIARFHVTTHEAAGTRAATVIGTPAYMSPEQLAGRADIDTRSDIYALGALLYKLLVGTTPFENHGHLSLEERLKSIRHGHLEPPSKRLHPSRAEDETIARQRGVPVATLQQRLKGDLDRICLKALAADRGERYATALEFAQDLTRFLENRPVSATPPGTWYRLGRFIRRHRLGVLAASTVTAALLVGFSSTTMAFLQARRAESDARASAVKAQDAATRTKAAFTVLQNVLAAPDPYAAGIDIRVSELLARFPRELPQHLIDDETEALLRQTIGRTYMSLGRHEEALIQLQLAEALNGCLLGDEDPQTLETALLKGGVLAEMGNFEEAKDQGQLLLRRAWLNFGENHQLTLRALIHLVGVYIETRHFPEAMTLGESNILLTLETLGPDHPETILLTSYLGQTMTMQREFEQAEAYLNHALHFSRQVYGPKHPRSLEILHNYLMLKVETNLTAEHLQLTKQLLSSQEEVRGPNHPYSLGALALRGHALLAKGAHRSALEAFENLLQRGEVVFGREHPRYAYCLQYLAKAAFAAGHHRQAVTYYRQALPIEVRTYGEASIRVAVGRYNLGLVLNELPDRSRQALQQLKMAATLFREQGEQAGLYFTLLALEPVMDKIGIHAEATRAREERVAISHQQSSFIPLSNMLVRKDS